MLKLIDLNSEILDLEKFKNSEISFNLIPYLIKVKDTYPEIRCYSDKEDVIVLNTDINHPVIIWTSDDFNKYEELYLFIHNTFFQHNPLYIMTNASCYLFFKDKGLVENDVNTKNLGVYKLDKLNSVPKSGYIDCAKKEDVEMIANMLKQFNQEALPDEQHPFSYYLEEANKFITCTDRYKVWKDQSGEITTIGRINIADTTGRIGCIYTNPHKRGHSYAKMLVQELAEIILKNNLLPVLYTNFKYNPSNRCYQAVGFKLLDVIYTYSIKNK